ncbi:hypothetical protein Taro_010097 [Colocasia esculenta]|uniref:ENTH domain-containing protein n=1 Tax=Colocasia esculenta TaxID=4460 RepID=A0A843U601_COLES|nr:hypothetical protein [Colocasia esculenta]
MAAIDGAAYVSSEGSSELVRVLARVWESIKNVKREVNKKVLKVPQIEQKIIMTMIWKRTNDTGKNWRHVYKTSGRRPSWRQPLAVEVVSASRHGRQH